MPDLPVDLSQLGELVSSDGGDAGAAGEMTLQEALAVPPEDDRGEAIRVMGPPDTFRLTFQDLEGITVRLEEWSYYDWRSRWDFVDGQLVWTLDIESVPDGTIFAQYYDPLALEAYLSPAEAAMRLGSPGLTQVELEDLDLEEATVLAGPQILLGFDADRLVYAETFALAPATP